MPAENGELGRVPCNDRADYERVRVDYERVRADEGLVRDPYERVVVGLACGR